MVQIFNSLFNEDARRLTEIVKKPVVDVIITSPPYADLKDYGVAGQIGYGQNYIKEYLPSLTNIFLQCFNVTKPTGSLWIVVDTFKKRGEVQLLPFEIASICKKSGWILTDIIIWNKGKTLPWSHKGRLRNLFEYILFFTKSNDHKYYVDRIKDPDDLKEWWVKYPERYSFGGKNPSNIWRIPIPVQGSWAPNGVRHFCPFPPELVERILLLTTDIGDVVLDPFSGSGMVLAQAFYMKRKYIGFEINPEYVKTFTNNVLPTMRIRRRQIQKEMLKLEKRRKDFENKIRGLRLLKYPKSIFKRLAQNEPTLSDNILAIFIEELNASPMKANKFIKAKITFIMNNDNKFERAKSQINSVVNSPPISKYGIESDIVFKTPTDIFSNTKNEPVLNKIYFYIYHGGKTHYYEEKSTFTEIGDKLISNEVNKMKKNTFPPIISTLGLRQEIIKTWQSKILSE